LAVGFYLAVTGPAAAQTLKTGYISKDLNYLPFFIAQKKGFHAKEIFRRDCTKRGTEVMVKNRPTVIFL
jgi:ABC-type nitrate/sulfonate/bicarbonate transport system substrate-binding protein